MYITLLLIFIGIFLLLSGIFFMRLGLKNLLWNKLQNALSKLTKTPVRGVIFGTIAAALMQSSTAVSLLTIGLVSAEYLTFYQGLGIILGANIGTCSTVQLMALTLPEQFFVPLFLLFIVIAIIIKKLRYLSMAIAGLFSMFIGLSILSDALGNLSEFSVVIDYLITAKEYPLYGIIGGTIITLLFQSSSAATGVLMTLASDNIIDITTACYIVYGNNIGSCLSSIVVGAAAPLAAKRVAVSHIILNILGVLLFYPFTPLLIKTATYLTADFAAQVAVIHTLFNIISSLAVLPIINSYAKLIMFLVPSKK